MSTSDDKPPIHHPDPFAERVEAIVVQYLATSLSEREDYLGRVCREQPELADSLRASLQALGAMGLMEDTSFSLPRRRLGEFELIERLGGGGMGVVYRAYQPALGRDVALKLIRSESLFFPGSRERFRREVEAIAKLQHPGIVPIYSVGEDDGVPYFAMELLHGKTLADLLRGLQGRAPESLRGEDLWCVLTQATAPSPESSLFRGSWIDACCEIVRQIAEALEHAHARGIVHRDIKPSNLILESDGRLRLLDFGLTSSGTDERITRSGSQVGTLPFMSPEQLRGQRVDARTDVYSLGVTLYELLALQLPFRGESSESLHYEILNGNPDRLRTRNRRVPAELEVLCFKSLERDLARRYESARSLADDLKRFLDRRPITARPPGPVLRSRRWVQRNPTLSVALLLGAVLGVGIPTSLYLQERHYSKEVHGSFLAEQQARRDAEDQLAIREQVVGFLLDTFRSADPDFSNGDQITARELLQRGATRIRTELAQAPRVRASLLRILGQVHRQIGLYDEARHLLTECHAQLDELPAPEMGLMVECLHDLGQTLHALGSFGEAQQVLLRAEQVSGTTRPETPWLTASIQLDLANAYAEAREFEHAQQWLESAAPIFLERAPNFPAEAARALDTRAGVLVHRAQWDPRADRDALLQQAERLLLESAQHWGRAGIQDTVEVALHASELGLALKLQGKLERAGTWYQRAMEEFERLLGPDNLRLASMLSNYAGLLESSSRGEEAVAPIERAIAILEKHYADKPAHPDLVLFKGNRAGLLYRLNRYHEAALAYEQVLPLQQQVYPDSFVVPISHRNLAVCLIHRGELDRAETHALASLDFLESRMGPQFSKVAMPLLVLAQVYEQQLDYERARDVLERALTLVPGDQELELLVPRMRELLARLPEPSQD